jgi:mannonate dehydratase
LPPELANHSLVREAWAGIDAARVWDSHVHIAGTGDSDSGIVVGPQLSSPLHPLQYVQRLFYMNAGCAHEARGRVDQSYVERLRNLMDGFPPGAKLLLLAFDHFHDEAAKAQPQRSAFFVPDAYARALAAKHGDVFEWASSIHPYRADAVAALESAAAQGARAVKWLPAAMNIDPASPRCDAFYTAAARLDIPLIVHCGEEKAVQGSNTQAFGNPLRLRRALDHGVRVIVAHCASLGEDVDLDRGDAGPVVPSFDLFARLMDEPRYQKLLYADISALTQRNRAGAPLRAVLERREWHGRLLNGSDYPLPGILPLFSPAALAADGLLDRAAVQPLEDLRGHNPLLFDFVLKRHLRVNGVGFPAAVFETRRFFVKETS